MPSAEIKTFMTETGQGLSREPQGPPLARPAGETIHPPVVQPKKNLTPKLENQEPPIAKPPRETTQLSQRNDSVEPRNNSTAEPSGEVRADRRGFLAYATLAVSSLGSLGFLGASQGVAKADQAPTSKPKDNKAVAPKPKQDAPVSVQSQQVAGIAMHAVKEGQTRTFVPRGDQVIRSVPSTPEPTVTPENPGITVEQWYLKAHEVPGTRLEKTEDGKFCLLRSLVDANANYKFAWRTNFPSSIENVRSFMAQDQLGKGYEGQEPYDELVIAAFSSKDSAPANIPLSEIRVKQSDGSMRSVGYFGHTVFEMNGKKIRIAGYAPPTGGISFDTEFIANASGKTAAELVYVSVAGNTPVDKMTSEQDTRSDETFQDYLNIVKLFPK